MVDTISELSDLSRKLNQQSDKLNAVISSINSKLGRLNLGIEVWLTNRPIMEDDLEDLDDRGQPTDPYFDATVLGYCRVGDEWQLAVEDIVKVIKYDEVGEQYTIVKNPTSLRPLLRATREVRAQAMALIPTLLDSIKVEATDLLGSIERAEKAAEKL
jgi:hypothetical protein